MHDRYFGRGSSMSSPTTAALDPAFFLFHSYIDLLYEFRLQAHGDAEVTSRRHVLRATQPESVVPPPGHRQGAGLPNMGQPEIYFDTSKLLYSYEVMEADRLPAVEEVEQLLIAADGKPARFGATEKSLHARLLGDGLLDAGDEPSTLVATIPVPIMPPDGPIAAKFARSHRTADLSFAVDFYLHPAQAELKLEDTILRQRYIVDVAGYWGGGMGDHDAMGEPAVYADLTAAVADLAATGHSGEDWTVTAVVSGPPPDLEFGDLSLVR
jgi:hypothetical protein